LQPSTINFMPRRIDGAVPGRVTEISSGDLPNAQKDSVPVQRAERHCPQDEKIERSGKNLSLITHSEFPLK
jgi:hypothetical protein